MTTIALFGSTGSIGRNTLEVVRSNPDAFRVRYLTSNSNSRLLCEQAEEFRPTAVALVDTAAADDAKRSLGGRVEVLSGVDGLLELARRDDYGTMVSAMVGFSGLLPTIEAVKTNKTIALANKETLVVAGEIITSLLRTHAGALLPIDSEHSAILQCLHGENPLDVERLILTASGGPFRGKSLAELSHVTCSQALDHPNWKMGNKITIDSATLMNKGLEIIEARWLFGLDASRIDVVIHPQSIIHSMVTFRDGSTKAQLGLPDMKIPIQYALSYPRRLVSSFPRIDFTRLTSLTFETPDPDTFRCLRLASDALAAGGTAPACLNAANEIAVGAFLDEQISFLDIPAVIADCLDAVPAERVESIDAIVDTDRRARAAAREKISARRKEIISVP